MMGVERHGGVGELREVGGGVLEGETGHVGSGSLHVERRQRGYGVVGLIDRAEGSATGGTAHGHGRGGGVGPGRQSRLMGDVIESKRRVQSREGSVELIGLGVGEAL